jgi:hypothetical protein
MSFISWLIGLFGHATVPQEEPDLTGLITAVDEAKSYYKSQDKAIDSIKTTARTIFSSASLVVSLLGASQIFAAQPQPGASAAPSPWFNYAIIAVVASYVIAMIFSLRTQLPVEFITPIKMDLEVIDADLVGKSKEDVQKQQLVNYLNAIENNRETIKQRKRWVKISATSFIITVVILLSAILFF